MAAGWTVHASRIAFRTPYISIREDTLGAGGAEPLTYCYVDAPGYALVVPRLADGRFLVLSHYRPPIRQALYEFPSGRIEADETPQAAAAREAAEETGADISDVRFLGAFFASAGSSNELAHLFLADARLVRPPSPGPGELFSQVTMAGDEIAAHLAAGRFQDGMSALAFTLARQHVAESPARP